jgi:predicted MFS family arabinose efflux permease
MLVRVVHGIGWGLFSAAAAVLAAQMAPPDRRGTALAMYGMAGGIALATGPVIGEAIGRSSAAFLTAAVAAGAGVALAALLPGGRHYREVVTGAKPRLAGLISVSALPPAAILLVYMITYGAVFSFMPVLTVRNGLGSPGWFFTAYAIALFIGRSATGYLSDRFGRPQVMGPGLLSAACALALIALQPSRLTLVVSAVLYGWAMAAIQPVALAWAVDRAPAQERGAAVATAVAAQDLGISAGSLLGGLIADRAGLPAVFAVNGVLAAAGFAVVAVVLGRRLMPHRRSHVHDQNGPSTGHGEV